MRYTSEDIEKLEEVASCHIQQRHIYSTDYEAFIPKGREVVSIHYEEGDYEYEPGLVILTLDNGDEVEASFDIDMLREHLDFEPCSYECLNEETKKNLRVWRRGKNWYSDRDSITTLME